MSEKPGNLRVAMITFESYLVKKVGGLAEVPPRLAKALKDLGVRVEVYTPSHGVVNACSSPVYSVGEYCISLLEGVEPKHYVVGGGVLDNPVVYPPGQLVEKSMAFARALSGYFSRILEGEERAVVFHGHDWHSYPALLALNTVSTRLGRRDVFVYHVHLLSRTRLALDDFCNGIGVCNSTLVRGVDGTREFGYYFERSRGFVERLAALTVNTVVTVSKGYVKSVERVMGPASWGRVEVVHNATPLTWTGVKEVLKNTAGVENPEDPSSRLAFRKWLLTEGLRTVELAWGSKTVEESVKRVLDQYDVDYREPFKSDGPLVFAIGRLSRQKGFDVLVKAMDRLLLYSPRLKVVATVVPLEWDLNLLRELVEAFLVYHESLRVLPGMLSRESTVKFYYAANATVIPSRSEPFGLVALESMASGTPVSASNVEGLIDIVLDIREHGWSGTGVLFERDNPVDLAEKTAYLVEVVESGYKEGPGVYVRESCTRRAEEFTWSKSAVKALEAYTRSLKP